MRNNFQSIFKQAFSSLSVSKNSYHIRPSKRHHNDREEFFNPIQVCEVRIFDIEAA